MFNHKPPTKVRLVEGESVRERERRREGRENVKGRVQRLLPIRCVCFLCFFSLFFTHTLVQQGFRGGDFHWGGRNFLPLSPRKGHKQEKRGSVYFEGVGTCLYKPAFCTCSALHKLCSQMERMQGELDHLEQPSPLTDKERVMIQDSWAKVYQSCDDAGVAILVRYF